MPATTVASTSVTSAAAASTLRTDGDVALERGDGGEVEERVHDGRAAAARPVRSTA